MGGFNKIDNSDLSFGDVVSYEVATDFKENIDLLTLMVPVGEIFPIMVGIVGVAYPDSNIFQECNGSEIVNANSPLRSIGGQKRYTPNMIDRYIKVPTAFGESGNVGGFNNSWIFRHNHAGLTGTVTSPEDGDASSSQDMTAMSHNHTISYDFDHAVNVEPPFMTVKYFMRIQ